MSKVDDYKIPGITPGRNLCAINLDAVKEFIIISHNGHSSVADAASSAYRNGTGWNVFVTEDGIKIGVGPDMRLETYMSGGGNFKGHGRKLDGNSLNTFAINIMLDGNGCEKEFPEAQINALIDLLEQITAKFGPLQIVGLADVDSKHCAPGPLFPWEKLAAKGLVIYPNIDLTSDEIIIKPGDTGVANIQKAFSSLGYYLPDITNTVDETTAKLMTNFDIHYNNGNCGHYNTETKTWTGHGFSPNDLSMLSELTNHAYDPLWEATILVGDAANTDNISENAG